MEVDGPVPAGIALDIPSFLEAVCPEPLVASILLTDAFGETTETSLAQRRQAAALFQGLRP